MFPDWTKEFARRSSRFLRRRRNFHLIILLTITSIWLIVFVQSVERDLPYFLDRIDLKLVLRYGNATDASMEYCLATRGVYTVQTSEATIIQPLTAAAVKGMGWLEEAVQSSKEHCSAHNPCFHLMGVSSIQPIFAIPARSEAIDSCIGKDQACYYDIAVNYFARRSGAVIKTRKPIRYICRAMLQQSVRLAPADYQEIQRTICRRDVAVGGHMGLVNITTAFNIASPQCRNILCEALTPEDKLQVEYCGRMRADSPFPLLPCFNSMLAFGMYMYPGPSRYYAFVPLAKGQVFWSKMVSLAIVLQVELILLTILYFGLWGFLRKFIRFLDTCAREEIHVDCTTDEELRWLVPASHCLHGHLDNLEKEKIITPQQHSDLKVRKLKRGQVYTNVLLRRFIVKNTTMERLRVYMSEAGIDFEDAYLSETSSESDSDHDTTAHPLAIMAVCQIFTTPCDDSSFERLWELEYINSHQWARIYDTREARGSFAAGALLLRIVLKNNKGKEFLLWFCEQFQVTENEGREITLAVTSDLFYFRHNISLSDDLWLRLFVVCFSIIVVGMFVTLWLYMYV